MWEKGDWREENLTCLSLLPHVIGGCLYTRIKHTNMRNYLQDVLNNG